MTARRFAQDTAVPTAQSQGEIKTMLRKAGADQVATFESDVSSSVAFRIRERFYRIHAPVRAGVKDPAQEERRCWRLLLLLIKAKLQAAAEGATTIEREFIADVVMPNGQSLAEAIEPQIALAYTERQMPNLLMLTGPQ